MEANKLFQKKPGLMVEVGPVRFSRSGEQITAVLTANDGTRLKLRFGLREAAELMRDLGVHVSAMAREIQQIEHDRAEGLEKLKMLPWVIKGPEVVH